MNKIFCSGRLFFLEWEGWLAVYWDGGTSLSSRCKVAAAIHVPHNRRPHNPPTTPPPPRAPTGIASFKALESCTCCVTFRSLEVLFLLARLEPKLFCRRSRLWPPLGLLEPAPEGGPTDVHGVAHRFGVVLGSVSTSARSCSEKLLASVSYRVNRHIHIISSRIGSCEFSRRR